VLRPQDKQGSGCGKEGILTNEELVKKIQAGEDPDGRLLYELYDQNRGLIVKWINHYGYTQYAEMEDLMQESFFAVHKTAYRWREGAKAKFTTYLKSWIQACLGRYVEDFGGPIRISSRRKKDIQRYSRFVSDYYMDSGRKPSDREIMDALDVSPAVLDRIREDIYRVGRIKSLDEPVGEDGENTLVDFVRDPSDVLIDAEQALFEEERRRAVWGAVSSLTKKEADAIKMRFQQHFAYSDIGANLGCTAQAADYTIRRGVQKLYKKHFRELSQFIDLSDTYTRGMRPVSVGNFQRNGTSSTEWAALKEINLDEQIKAERQRQFEELERREARIEALFQYWKQRAEEQQREKECRDSVNLSPDPITEA